MRIIAKLVLPAGLAGLVGLDGRSKAIKMEIEAQSVWRANFMAN